VKVDIKKVLKAKALGHMIKISSRMVMRMKTLTKVVPIILKAAVRTHLQTLKKFINKRKKQNATKKKPFADHKIDPWAKEAAKKKPVKKMKKTVKKIKKAGKDKTSKSKMAKTVVKKAAKKAVKKKAAEMLLVSEKATSRLWHDLPTMERDVFMTLNQEEEKPSITSFIKKQLIEAKKTVAATEAPKAKKTPTKKKPAKKNKKTPSKSSGSAKKPAKPTAKKSTKPKPKKPTKSKKAKAKKSKAKAKKSKATKKSKAKKKPAKKKPAKKPAKPPPAEQPAKPPPAAPSRSAEELRDEGKRREG
jgi:hypothetical protein